MAEENENSAEIEPSFNIDEWMKELLPDDAPVDTEFGEGQEPLPPPMSLNDASNINHNNMPMKLEESCNVASNTANTLTSMCPNGKPINPASGSSGSNLGRQNMQSNTLPNRYFAFPKDQTSRGMLSQQQVLKQTAQRSDIYPLPVHSGSPSTAQIQQQPPPKQNLFYGMLQQQQQQKFGNQSCSFMTNDQELFNVLQHPDPPSSQKRVIQQLPPQIQMQQQMNSRSFLDVKSKLPESTGFPPQSPMICSDQQKPANQTQLVHFDRSQDYNAQVRAANSSTDWIEAVFQQIQFLKEMYIFDVIRLLEKSREMRDQATNAESVSKHEKTRNFSERVIKFLQISKSDIVMNYTKEKAYRIIGEVSTSLGRLIPKNQTPLQRPQNHIDLSGSRLKAPQMAQRGSFLQYGLPNQFQSSSSLPLRQQSILNMQKSIGNAFQVGPSDGSRKRDVSSLMSPGFMRSPSGNAVPSIEQKSLNTLLHPPVGSAGYGSSMNPMQQRGASSRNMFNSLDSSLTSLTQNSNLSSVQARKQHDPSAQMQKFKQPAQQYMSEKNKQQMMQKMKDDSSLGYILGFNRKMSSLGMDQSFHAGSPQNSQHSAAHIEQKDMSSAFGNSATMLLSTPSPSVVPSPLTPSSVTVDSEKSPSCFYQLSVEESRKVPKTPTHHSQPVASDTLGSMKSPLIAESSSPSAVKLASPETKSPFKRLVEVVKSMSNSTLKDSLRDIHAITNMTDRTGEEFRRGESAGIIVRDLADDIRNYQNGNVCLVDGSFEVTKMQRQPNAVALEDSMSEREPIPDSRMKRLKTEASLDVKILQEIKEINRILMEVDVNVVNVKDGSAEEGIHIRCCYKPVGAVSEHGSSEETFPTLSLDLIVDADYPGSSPVVMEAPPPDFSGDHKGKELWMKAKSSFGLSLRKCSYPISLTEMAKIWGVCARAVFLEFAVKTGGGCFSSKYGKWEDQVTLFSAS